MTELEKMEYAKSVIEKLAYGINPLDDTSIQEDHILNNVQLSRCLFYVSDLLRQVIANGGTEKKKGELRNFELSEEKAAEFPYSESPIPISEIAKRLNALIADENMKKISYKDLTNWLLSIGLLEEQKAYDGRIVKRPTEQGGDMGIFTELRTGAKGPYTVVVYNKEAQAFMIDNLSAVVAMKYGK